MFGYADLLFTEQQVFIETSNRLKWFYEDGPKFIDLGFYLQQSFGKLDDVSTLTGRLQSIAYMDFVQFPYTLKLIYEQIMKGYYLESQILIRHLFETLLRLKYLNKHPEDIMEKVSFKKMVDDITKKPLYEYYKHLCLYTHGFIMKHIHRTDDTAGKTYFGNTYNQDNCMVPVNYLTELLLGFINVYELIYTKSIINEHIEVRELKNYINNQCILHGNNHMHDAMLDLIF